MGRFDALEIALDTIRSLVDVLPAIKRCDADLERNLRRAASSVPMNLAEGNRRVGKDRLHFFRIAAGSADEVRTGLRSAEAWRYVRGGQIGRSLALIDRLLAVIWRLTN